ncbi:rCG36763 [Rattus norvegicus]|uniref:RCG36763 n=1 Tax=Rattus norvegicus TaxID=10116 RepID=A6JRY3_RAT|nr:rCG36763 [Rattus norvegicus]
MQPSLSTPVCDSSPTFLPSRESVKGRPEAREASLLLGLKHIILQGHQIIKKQELSCKLRG